MVLCAVYACCDWPWIAIDLVLQHSIKNCSTVSVKRCHMRYKFWKFKFNHFCHDHAGDQKLTVLCIWEWFILFCSNPMDNITSTITKSTHIWLLAGIEPACRDHVQRWQRCTISAPVPTLFEIVSHVSLMLETTVYFVAFSSRIQWIVL